MNERSPIESVQSSVARVAHFIDGKRWPELRALYADEVDVDYTSLFGGAAQRQNGDELIGGWRTLLAEITTQHLLGPIDVTIDGAVASAECHVRAGHYARGMEWVVEGHYVFALARRGDAWRITGMLLQAFHEHGTRKVLEATGA